MTLVGAQVYVENVDNTTLCTPMVNAQFDGYNNLISRDYSLIARAESGWYVPTESDSLYIY